MLTGVQSRLALWVNILAVVAHADTRRLAAVAGGRLTARAWSGQPAIARCSREAYRVRLSALQEVADGRLTNPPCARGTHVLFARDVH